MLTTGTLQAREAVFIQGVSLNGPAVVIDGRKWSGSDATNLLVNGQAFENQTVALKPPADPVRARMIRSSRMGSKLDVQLTDLPEGTYQAFLYIWEDTLSERLDLLVNDQVVIEGFHTGNAGSWKKLGPWKCQSVQGRIKISARAASHGAANLSGIELWSGDGTIPAVESMPFASAATPGQSEFFERRIRPVLVENCFECHSAGAKKIKGGLVLDSKAGTRKGGDTGPAIAPGDTEASLLIQAIRHADPDLAMPPRKKLPEEAIADLEQWVRMGAPDPRTDDATAASSGVIDWNKARDWWSFRPVSHPSPPQVDREDWPWTPVDRFLLAKLEEKKLSPAKDAQKRTLIRRATFDLTGLPPTPEEIDAFLADSSRDAFEQVIERLLASPRYGERWGRHWLDVVRYADSAGDNSDFPVPQMYRYRNWVISAFNRDLPYDQFVRQQLAGDLIPGATDLESYDRIIATGYIANSRRFGSRVDDYPQHLTIEDTIDNLGRTFLGLTINCARCHDHKFDPIPTTDYYALYGIFNSTRYPWPGIELDQNQRDLVPLVPRSRLAETEAARQDREKEIRKLQAEVQRLKDSLKSTPADEKKAVEENIKQAEKIAKAAKTRPFPFELAYAVSDSTKPADAPVQQKGDPSKPGLVVRRGFLTVLEGESLPPGETSSGRRQLADWIVNRSNPLTARVLANRVWLHHFGRGLVSTPNDFGKQGKPPTHPELLDWLASRLMDSGWSIKALHRVIMRSHAYQISGARSPESLDRDAGNELFGSFPRQRVDAEALRDTLLTLGNSLEHTATGPHPFPHPSDWKFTQHNPFKAVYDSNHRSVYLMTQRTQRHPYLALFDGADPSASTPVRPASTTPLQALFLLNDSSVHEQSRRFASRIAASSKDATQRLIYAYQQALGRLPDSDEIAAGRELLAAVQHRWISGGMPEDQAVVESWNALVRVIFRLNEFAYVD